MYLVYINCEQNEFLDIGKASGSMEFHSTTTINSKNLHTKQNMLKIKFSMKIGLERIIHS